MKERISAFNKEQAAPLWQSLAANAIPIDRSLEDPVKPEEEFVYFSN
jgi:hypothetical protein